MWISSNMVIIQMLLDGQLLKLFMIFGGQHIAQRTMNINDDTKLRFIIIFWKKWNFPVYRMSMSLATVQSSRLLRETERRFSAILVCLLQKESLEFTGVRSALSLSGPQHLLEASTTTIFFLILSSVGSFFGQDQDFASPFSNEGTKCSIIKMSRVARKHLGRDACNQQNVNNHNIQL